MTNEERKTYGYIVGRMSEMAGILTERFKEADATWAKHIMRDAFSDEADEMEDIKNAIGEIVETIWETCDRIWDFMGIPAPTE